MTDDPETERLLALLYGACKELVFVSETDAAIEPVSFRDADEMLDYLKRVGSEVDVSNALTFFDRLTEPRAWHGVEERTRAKRFSRLRKIMEERLTELKIYRVGKIRIDVFVLGRTESGAIAGVKTRAVET